MRARMTTLAVAGILALSAVAAPTPDTALAARKFANCKALNKVYPHGVGKPGAKDKVSGKYRPGRSVTNFKKSLALYNANKARDGDKDGIACEKR